MTRAISSIWLLLAVFILQNAVTTAPAFAQTVSQEESSPEFWNGQVLLFPADDLHQPYIADPYRPTNALTFQLNTVTDIPDSSGARVWTAAGGRFGILRLQQPNPEGRLLQVSIEAGLDAQYDSGSNLDNIGYDGNYGLTVTTKKSDAFTLLFAYRHVSGHVGDEWLKENDRQRIGYRRDELSVGGASRIAGSWRLYGEVGYGIIRLNEELQRPWRLQTGVEREWPRSWAKGRLGWYVAADVQSHEERNWDIDLSLEAGMLATSAGRRWRIGVRYVVGHPPLTEFFQDDEQWLSAGLWMDF